MLNVASGKNRWANYFELKTRGTTLGREIRGGFATFLTLSYILFTNPQILSAAGVPIHSATACTALAAGLCTLFMGLWANFPIALASGMGLNAVVAFQVSSATGSWQTAMGLVVVEGIIITALVLAGFRESVMNAIPRSLRIAMGAGIGFFITFIGLVNAKLVVVPQGSLSVLSSNPSAVMPPVTFGSFQAPESQVALLGLLVSAVLLSRKITGALVYGILASTLLAFPLGLAHWPTAFPQPSFENAFQADILGALKWSFLPLLLSLLLVDFFDTLGTVTAVSEQAQLKNKSGQIPRLRRILFVDSLSASIGGLFGASSVTSYIESSAGVAEGARTGLHNMVVAALFFLAIFLAPLASVVPNAATAPALILVGFLMSTQITQIPFEDWEVGIPAFLCFLCIPLTFSISHGIGYGFLAYTAIKIGTGKIKELHPILLGISGLFLCYFFT